MADEAFVICQVGGEGSSVRARADEIFDYIVKPVTDELGLTPKRSDMDPTPGQVTVQIIQSLTSARVVIADLTGRNANVYYELAVAHSFAIPVVILVDTAASLSFDTSTERVIEIGEGDRLAVAEAEKAKGKLAESLRVVLGDGYRPSSLVSEAAQARSLDALAPENPVAQELADLRDRLEVVVKQTGQSDRFRASATFLFDMIRKLATRQEITTRSLERAGINLAKAPNEGTVDLQGALEGLIKPPPPPPAPTAPDDDIPF